VLNFLHTLGVESIHPLVILVPAASGAYLCAHEVIKRHFETLSAVQAPPVHVSYLITPLFLFGVKLVSLRCKSVEPLAAILVVRLRNIAEITVDQESLSHKAVIIVDERPKDSEYSSNQASELPQEVNHRIVKPDDMLFNLVKDNVNLE